MDIKQLLSIVPALLPYHKGICWQKKLSALINKLNKKIDSFDEKDLDRYILPHPLLGKLTIREMLFFTVYHVQHHQSLTLKTVNK